MSGSTLIVSGVTLFITGFVVAGSGQKSSVRIGNTGLSVFGSIRQTFHNAGMAINGDRQKTPRDWIGWSLSLIGIGISVVGIVMS